MTSSGASITILALNQSETQALQDWSRGLDWVRWLLGDVRSRLETLSAGLASPAQAELLPTAWAHFTRHHFLPLLGPALRDAWQAAHDGKTRRLIQIARALEQQLPPGLAEASHHAAHLLLRSTRGAAFQEVLGKHRAAIADGRCPAHFVCVWACVGSLFQLGLANVCAEYLRLEWSILSRLHPHLPEPEGRDGILTLTRYLLPESPFSENAAPPADAGDPSSRQQH